MSNCYITIGATKYYPLLPVEYSSLLIREQQRMLNGQLRTAHRAEKLIAPLQFGELAEAERTSLLAVATPGAAVTFIDEHGTSRSMVVQSIDKPLVRTVPAVEGGLTTTGPGYYDITITLEEV